MTDSVTPSGKDGEQSDAGDAELLRCHELTSSALQKRSCRRQSHQTHCAVP